MILNAEWLNKYISLPKKLRPLLDQLTEAGLEVELIREKKLDTTFMLNVAPNRPDCLGFLGVARELSVILKKPLYLPKTRIKEGKNQIQDKIKVILKDSVKCPRYMGRFIEGVKIGPSPEWLRKSLESIGQKSINNVVDITNYVLMEIGQPLHAFDADKIQDQTVMVRRANPGEKIVTLDGLERTLELNDLVIADVQKPMALAGIMGGASSEISENTKNIFLESAFFSPPVTRKTSKRLGLISESSKRFERGVDISGVPWALDRATHLISEVAGGIASRGVIDLYPKKMHRKQVALRINRLTQMVGYSLSITDIKETLKWLGFKLKSQTPLRLIFEVPFHRIDVTEEVDLIEEIARVKGYHRIPIWEPTGNIHLEQEIETQNERITQLKTLLVGAGLTEVINYSFYSPENLKKIGWYTQTVTKIRNPLGEEYSIMRPSLIPSLLKNVEFNLHHQTHRIRIFELRNVYDEKGNEKKMLAGLISGPRHSLNWGLEEKEVDFYDLKAIVSLVLGPVELRPLHHSPLFQPGVASEIWISSGKLPHRVGMMGKIHPTIQESFELKQVIYLFELDISLIREWIVKKGHFQSIPKYPFIHRDLSILVPLEKSITFDFLYQALIEEGGPLLKKVELFDLYRGGSIPKGYQSMTFSLLFRSDERTLQDEEVNKIHEKICRYLEQKWQIKIR